MKKEEDLSERCKLYKTTLTSCNCLGFQYRRKCKHIEYLRKREEAKIGVVKIEDGTDSVEALEKYGEEWINGMIERGEIYERGGKLYNLK